MSEVTLDAILRASNGDMRKAVTFLQSAHQLSAGQAAITPEIVIDISGQVKIFYVFVLLIFIRLHVCIPYIYRSFICCKISRYQILF